MEATERFAEMVRRPENEISLDEAALLIAAHASDDMDLNREMSRLDRLAERCYAPTLDALRRHLFVDLGFRGNRDDYFDPRNSLLNQVAGRRLGIPISLSVLAMAVGRRIGVPMSGISMPGHFLLRDRVDPDVFVDPFSRGAVLDRSGCEQVFRSVQGSSAVFDTDYLEPVGPRVILARMLANLKIAYAKRSTTGPLAWVVGLRCMIPGVPLEERLEWAQILAERGNFDQAAHILERGADMAASDAEQWQRLAIGYRARMN